MFKRKIIAPKTEKKKLDFSKKLILDVRWLLWIVTIGGLALAFYCIHDGYIGSLPWVSAMVGLPWTAHGTICSFYLNMAKSDHSVGGITYESAMLQAKKTTEKVVEEYIIDPAAGRGNDEEENSSI